jgi:hypothetical protein
MAETVDLYNNVYADFGSRAEAAVRREAFGADIGQSSWLTAAEWLRFADQAQVTEHSRVLEVGSGSGGPAVYLATARGCRVVAIAARWHAAREQHRGELVDREGVANFEGLQRFLSYVHRLSAERRLSRYAYLAERHA